MRIQELIGRYIASDPRIYGRDHQVVPPQRLRAEFSRIRTHLRAEHKEGDLVALYLRKDERYFLTVLACMDLGLTYIPLRVEWPMARVEQIRELSGFKTLVTDDFLSRFIARPEPAGEAGPFLITPDKPLYVIFTSGSTGAPKGVIIGRAAYLNHLTWMDHFYEVSSTDRLLNVIDYTFDPSLVEVGLVLLRHCPFYMSNFVDDIFVLLHELDSLKINAVVTVPNNFVLMLRDGIVQRADLTALRQVLISGARFPAALHRRFQECLPHATVYNRYGPTEVTIDCVAKKLSLSEGHDIRGDNVSIGTAVDGCLPLIVDAELRPGRPGEQGELLVGGAQLMAGYLNNKAATRRSMVEIDGVRYFRTGDLVFQDERGEMFVVGRLDDTVKVAGQRTNLSDVDAYVQRLPYVVNCATIAIPDDQRGAYLVLYVVLSTPRNPSEIMRDLRTMLVKHQLPHEILPVDHLPVNNSGKVSKKDLKEGYLARVRG